MGALTSRQNAGVEEVDISSNHAYKYPPRCGNYFGSHFIMGGERFDTPQPEAYLFGENADLNFLGSRPTPFPYPPPQANEPTKTLKSLVNIRKESLRFIRVPDKQDVAESRKTSSSEAMGEEKPSQFNIEFTFDSDCRCAITIYYFCTEEVSANGIVYTPRDATMNSKTYHYKRGANQQFSQVSHIFDPSQFSEEELAYNTEREIIPIAIHCVAEDGTDEPHQSHTTIAVVDCHADGTFVLKALKQKLYVDGLSYLLQEIYGIENKNAENGKNTADDDSEDNGSECVICMCDVRDTLILPCRHLCLCNSCADSLRYQANNCPICRSPFRALLQIRALQRSSGALGLPTAAALPTEGCCENIPAGYEAVSLIEALNGPYQVRTLTSAPPVDIMDPPDQEGAVRAAEVLNRSTLERSQSQLVRGGTNVEEPEHPDSPKEIKGVGNCTTPEFRMSVLLAQEEDNQKEQQAIPIPTRRQSRPHNRDKSALLPRDTVRVVNEKDTSNADDTPDQSEPEPDSEAEKMSPLLDAATSTDPSPVADHIAGLMIPDPLLAIPNMDDDDDLKSDSLADDKEEETCNSIRRSSSKSRGSVRMRNGEGDGLSRDVTSPPGDESDYYTPEDPGTTILSPLHVDKESTSANMSVESTPGKSAIRTVMDGIMGGVMSLPGTPLSNASHLSNRSSGDSFSSSSSTRQLLPINHEPTSQDKAVP